MKVTLLKSAIGSTGDIDAQYTTSFVINDTVAVDAGSLGFTGDPQDQAKIKHVLISHTHIDHVASLPIFVENSYEAKRDCVTVYGSSNVLDSLRTDVFNNRLWPDFIALSKNSPAPFLHLQEIRANHPFELEGLRFSPVEVNHVVPTMGFVIDDGKSAFAIVSDTGPTSEIWRIANETPNLRGVFLEVTFPSAMDKLAEISKHLTPAMLLEESKKLKPGVPIFIVHLKARFREQISRELAELKMPAFHVARFGDEYEF